MTDCLAFQHFFPFPSQPKMIGNRHEIELPPAPRLTEFLVWTDDPTTFHKTGKNIQKCISVLACQENHEGAYQEGGNPVSYNNVIFVCT